MKDNIKMIKDKDEFIVRPLHPSPPAPSQVPGNIGQCSNL